MSEPTRVDVLEKLLTGLLFASDSLFLALLKHVKDTIGTLEKMGVSASHPEKMCFDAALSFLLEIEEAKKVSELGEDVLGVGGTLRQDN